MKYTINGFSQNKLISFGLDSADANILRWFVDFYHTGKMAIIKHDNKDFVWVSYQAIIDDLPILQINSKDVLARRFKKYVDCGLVEHHTHRSGGVFSCYRLNPEAYNSLISDIQVQKSDHTTIKSEGHDSKVGTPSDSKVGTKDSSTIINHSTKESKSLAGPRPAVKRVKSPEQIAKDTEINNQLTDLLEFCKSENYTVNPDSKFKGIMIASLKREGPDRVKKAIRNYLADVKTNGKYAGSFETLFYNPGRMAKYANMQEEKQLVKTW